jgi:hypothetical protein
MPVPKDKLFSDNELSGFRCLQAVFSRQHGYLRERAIHVARQQLSHVEAQQLKILSSGAKGEDFRALDSHVRRILR